jgi:Cd2+/Zn2+-exporting ATPase
MKEHKLDLKLTSLLPEIDLEGDDCVRRLELAMQDQKGISKAHIVDPSSMNALRLHIDPSVISHKEARKLAERVSSKITHQYRHLIIPIEGMDCSDCALVLEHALSRMVGVLKVAVDYPTENMRIEFDSRRVTKNDIEVQVRRLGYSVPRNRLFQYFEDNKAFVLSVITGLFTLIGWLGENTLSFPTWAIFGAYSLAYAAGGIPLLRESFIQLTRERQFDTDQLMIAAALGAAALGEFTEGAVLLFLFGLGHALEGQALKKAGKAIHDLKDLAPKTALVVRDSGYEAVPIDQVTLDDVVMVSSGSRIPIDGIVRSGSSMVNQSQITGESLPVEVAINDRVFAGSVNGNGTLEIIPSKLAKDSTLAKIAQLVQEAQAEKAPSQHFSDQVMRYLVPGLLIGDILLILIPPLFGTPFRQSFLLAMTLLVAASPCALALGTPSTILAAVARAARHGILVKGGVHLEALATVETIAFDKTGTLSTGEPTVTDVLSFKTMAADQLLATAAAVEIHSSHPLAAAITGAANEKDLQIPSASNILDEPGFGVSAIVAGKPIRIGKLIDFDRSALPDNINTQIRNFESNGKTVVAVHVDSDLMGVIAVSDQIRASARPALQALRRSGVNEILMLSGDNAASATAIGDQLGIEQVHANLMPNDKLEIISAKTTRGEVVGMVGDGVNDAPALAKASVGIAMGGARNQVALDTADIVLMSDDLSRLPFAIDLSQRTRRIIRQNFVLALGMIGGLIALTLLNLAGITLAIVLHEGSTLLVVFNALRLLGYKDRFSTTPA